MNAAVTERAKQPCEPGRCTVSALDFSVTMRGRRIATGWLFLVSVCVLSSAVIFAKEDGDNVELLMDALDGEDSILPEGLDLDLEDEDSELGQEEERSLEEFLEEEVRSAVSRCACHAVYSANIEHGVIRKSSSDREMRMEAGGSGRLPASLRACQAASGY